MRVQSDAGDESGRANVDSAGASAADGSARVSSKSKPSASKKSGDDDSTRDQSDAGDESGREDASSDGASDADGSASVSSKSKPSASKKSGDDDSTRDQSDASTSNSGKRSRGPKSESRKAKDRANLRQKRRIRTSADPTPVKEKQRSKPDSYVASSSESGAAASKGKQRKRSKRKSSDASPTTASTSTVASTSTTASTSVVISTSGTTVTTAAQPSTTTTTSQSRAQGSGGPPAVNTRSWTAPAAPTPAPTPPAATGSAPGKRRRSRVIEDEEDEEADGDETEVDERTASRATTSNNRPRYQSTLSSSAAAAPSSSAAAASSSSAAASTPSSAAGASTAWTPPARKRLKQHNLPKDFHAVKRVVNFRRTGTAISAYQVERENPAPGESRTRWVPAADIAATSDFAGDIALIEQWHKAGGTAAYPTLAAFIRSLTGRKAKKATGARHGAGDSTMSCGYDAVGIALLSLPNPVTASMITAFRENGAKRRKMDLSEIVKKGVTWAALRNFIKSLKSINIDIVEKNLFSGNGQGITALALLGLSDGIYLVGGWSYDQVGHYFVLEVTCGGQGVTVHERDNIGGVELLQHWLRSITFVRRVLPASQ
ncbi:hypothetical protein PINS_up016427 [Pythium insidiosum]|nr:hypothetical protein PINS_up016427 [Pythium insidiosum]